MSESVSQYIKLAVSLISCTAVMIFIFEAIQGTGVIGQFFATFVGSVIGG